MDELTKSNSVRRCWNCKKELNPSDALVCVECDSPQDWRRYVMVSQTTLALIVAILSILTVVLPIIGKLIEADRSKIEAGGLRLREDQLIDTKTLLIETRVANVGKNPALIRSFLIQFNKDVGCGAREVHRTCGEKVLPEGACELVYFVNGHAVETPTSRIVRPNQIEVAQLHFLLKAKDHELKYRDILSDWNNHIYADIRNSDGSKECLDVDISSIKK